MPKAAPRAGSLDILRRLEPVLSRIEAEQSRQAELLAKLDERQRKQGEDMARMDGRVSQLPTLWQLAGLVFAIFGAAFVLIRFASTNG